MAILRNIAIAVCVVVTALLAYAATKPDAFRVQREITIKAPAENIFAHINDLQAWRAWSPWEKKDPAMKRSFSGPASGKGAAYAWDGNGEVGKGRMEITEAVPPSRVVIKLDFLEPIEGHNTAELTLQPAGDATRVTWAMYGPSPYVSKLIQLVFNFDTMIGTDFEAGLASLKSIAEQPTVK